MSEARSAYGEWCPHCGNPIISVTRGIPSMGTCSEGHTTDRRDTLRRQPIPPKTYTEVEAKALVAAAVEAERQRCAKIARRNPGYLLGALADGTPWVEIPDIAALILEVKP